MPIEVKPIEVKELHNWLRKQGRNPRTHSEMTPHELEEYASRFIERFTRENGHLIDLHIIEMGDSRRDEALARTVDRVPWKLFDEDFDALRKRALEECLPSATVKRYELTLAILSVLPKRHSPQKVRLQVDGQMQSLVYGDNVLVVPDELPDILFWRWFCGQVTREARKGLLMQGNPAKETEDLFVSFPESSMRTLVDFRQGPEALIIEQLEQLELMEFIQELPTRCREVLLLLNDGMPIPEISNRLGVRPNTVYSVRHDLKNRLQARACRT